MAVDPVCYMDVDESAALKDRRVGQYRDQTFYFCCEDCQQRFLEQPWLYARPMGDGHLAWPTLAGETGLS